MNHETPVHNPIPYILSVLLCMTLLWGCTSKRVEDILIPDTQPVLNGIDAKEASTEKGIKELRSLSGKALLTSLGTPQEAKVKEITDKLNTTLDNLEATMKANPAREEKKLIEALTKAIEDLKEIIQERDAEILALKDANAKRWYWILSGLGVACTLGAVASGFFATSIPIVGPMLGPRIGILLGALAGTCFLLVYLFNWAREHPAIAAALVVGLLCTAVGIAWANKYYDRENNALFYL